MSFWALISGRLARTTLAAFDQDQQLNDPSYTAPPFWKRSFMW